MKMNVLLIAIAASFAISSCNSTMGTSSSATENIEVNSDGPPAPRDFEDGPITYSIAKNYFVKNTYKNDKVEAFKISTEEQFDKIFGMAATMGEGGQPTKIDFSKSYVIAMIGTVASVDSDFTLNSLVKKGNEVILQYTVNSGKELSFSTQPCMVLILDNRYPGEVKFEKK